MVPESPSVCFRCKMCKVCFLTMNEIERHLKATNHYIRPSSNNTNNNNNNNNNATKEKSTAKNNESSVGGGDEKPLNLSRLPPLSSPDKKADKIHLTVSSEGSGREDDKRPVSKGSMKAEKVLGGQLQREEHIKVKKEVGPKTVFLRKVSVEKDSLFATLAENSLHMKNATTQKSTADIETDTVSSTSSDPPMPPEPDKNLGTLIVPDTNEAEAETQIIKFDETEQPTTTHLFQKNGVLAEEDNRRVRTSESPMEILKKKEKSCATTTLCDETDSEMAETQMIFDDTEEKTISTTAVTPPPSQISTSTQEVLEVVDNADGQTHNETKSKENCELYENENNEPETKRAKEMKEKPKFKQSITKSRANNNNNNGKNAGSDQKLKYRCKHCGDKFDFPVQVHVHMRKVHFTADKANLSRRESNKSSRRSSVNTSTSHNNNNNDTAKVNVQMYPLRSLYARAKRRTRSMQSDGGGTTIRRNSIGQRVVEERKERKTRKTISFSCKYCGKKFPLLNQMKSHVHTVHPDTVKTVGNTTLIGGSRKRKNLASKRLFLGSKRRKRTTAPPRLVQAERRSLRVSTRSVSKSADSEPETVRMSTRRSSVAKSEKSGVASSASSRRSSTKVRDQQDSMRIVSVKEEIKVIESDPEENTSVREVGEKTRRGKLRYSSCNSGGSNNKETSVVEESILMNEEDSPREKTLDVSLREESHDGEDEEVDTIYNDSDCMIIDTVETILYALTSRRSQTCPNCNKYCKFAGNFRLHIKACMNLDDDLEVRTDIDNVQTKSEPVSDEAMEEEEEENEGKDDVETDAEEYTENDADSSASIPYYQQVDYRRCWHCGFIVSKFHNLSRHLRKKHNVSMGTKEMHAKQSEILRSK